MPTVGTTMSKATTRSRMIAAVTDRADGCTIDLPFGGVRRRMLSLLGDLMAAGADASRRWRTEPARVRAFLDSLGDGSMFCDCEGSADPIEACGSA
jgi:hypothetical protein